MDIVKGNMGWIEVICGPMFSGKSEELIRRLRRAEIARQRVQIFKPVVDQRYAENEIVSHSELRIAADTVAGAEEILARVDPRTEVVGIDEAQFLGSELVSVCQQLADAGKRVIVAGLDTDYLGRSFEPIPQLLTVANGDRLPRTVNPALTVLGRPITVAPRVQAIGPGRDVREVEAAVRLGRRGEGARAADGNEFD